MALCGNAVNAKYCSAGVDFREIFVEIFSQANRNVFSLSYLEFDSGSQP